MNTKATNKSIEAKELTLQERLDGMTDNQRIEFLEANAYAVKEVEYRAPLTEEELGEVKDFISRAAIKLQELEDEKERFMQEWKEKVKQVEPVFDNAVREARQMERIGRGRVYDMVDSDSKTVYRVAEGNLIVGTRPATKEELAPRLFHA